MISERSSGKTSQTSREEGHCKDDDLSNEKEREGVARPVKVHGGVVVEAEGRLLLAPVRPAISRAATATKELRILSFIG